MSPAARIWRLLRRDYAFLTGLLVLLVLAGGALLSPWIAQDPEAMDLSAIFAPPSPEHWLGADELGRDVLARLAHGGRISLAVAAATALLAALVGTMLGLLAGYYGGRLDAVLMRLTDGVMALPLLPLLIVLAAIDPAKLGIPPEQLGSEAFAIGPIGQGPRLRAGRHRHRRQPCPRHAPPHPAQRGLAGCGGDHAVGGQHHSDRKRTILPGPRHPPTAGVVGQHADRRHERGVERA